MKDIDELGLIIEKEIKKVSYSERPNFLYDPIIYIMGLKAKRIRPILVLMAYQLFDKKVEKARVF